MLWAESVRIGRALTIALVAGVTVSAVTWLFNADGITAAALGVSVALVVNKALLYGAPLLAHFKKRPRSTTNLD